MPRSWWCQVLEWLWWPGQYSEVALSVCSDILLLLLKGRLFIALVCVWVATSKMPLSCQPCSLKSPRVRWCLSNICTGFISSHRTTKELITWPCSWSDCSPGFLISKKHQCISENIVSKVSILWRFSQIQIGIYAINLVYPLPAEANCQLRIWVMSIAAAIFVHVSVLWCFHKGPSCTRRADWQLNPCSTAGPYQCRK